MKYKSGFVVYYALIFFFWSVYLCLIDTLISINLKCLSKVDGWQIKGTIILKQIWIKVRQLAEKAAGLAE